jgi:MFS transporter, DHA1 family, inner membrane transport protein
VRAAVPEPPPVSPWIGRVLLLGLGTFAVGTDAFVVAGFLPATAAELGVSVAAAGQSVTVFAIAYAVLSPVVATLTATLPRRTLLTLALCALALANLGSAFAPAYAVLLVTRVIAAAGAAGFTPHAAAVAASLAPLAYRGRALAIVIGGLTVATAVGVPLGTLASQVMGWRTALALVAALCLVVAGGLRLLLPALPGEAPMPLRARLALLRAPAVRRILPVSVLGMAAAYTAYAYAVPAFEAVGIRAEDSEWMLLLYGIGAVAGAAASGRLVDRFGGVAVLTGGYAVLAIALAAFGALTWAGSAALTLVAILSFLWGGATWCQSPAQQHRLIEAAPESASLVIALNASAIYAGIGIGTLIGGAIGESRTGWMFAVGAALALVAGAVLLAGSRAERRRSYT